MCFAIPYRVIDVNKNIIYIENGQRVKLGKELSAQKGDYVQIIGNVAVAVLNPDIGLSIRKQIKKINNEY